MSPWDTDSRIRSRGAASRRLALYSSVEKPLLTLNPIDISRPNNSSLLHNATCVILLQTGYKNLQQLSEKDDTSASSRLTTLSPVAHTASIPGSRLNMPIRNLDGTNQSPPSS